MVTETTTDDDAQGSQLPDFNFANPSCHGDVAAAQRVAVAYPSCSYVEVWGRALICQFKDAERRIDTDALGSEWQIDGFQHNDEIGTTTVTFRHKEDY
jgi:hypothetical protein